MALHKTNKTAHVLNLLATGEPEPDQTDMNQDKPEAAASPSQPSAQKPAPPAAGPAAKHPERQGLAPNISIVNTDDGSDPLADLIRASLSKEIQKESGQTAAAPAKETKGKGSKKAKAAEPAMEEASEEEEPVEEAASPSKKKSAAKSSAQKKTASKKKAAPKVSAEDEEEEETPDDREAAESEPEEAIEEEPEAPAPEAKKEALKAGKSISQRLFGGKGGKKKDLPEPEEAPEEPEPSDEKAATAGEEISLPPSAQSGLDFEEAMAAAENNANKEHAHGYPGESPEKAFLSSPPTEDSYCYVNMMEMIVDDRLLEFMNRFGLCTCDRCVLDTKALALANLPPKYIVAPIESLPPLLSFYKNKYSLNLITELTKACLAVLDNPRH